MASTSSNRKKTNKKSTNSSKKKIDQNQNNSIIDEIIILVLLAVSILMLISNFGFGGKMGEVIAAVTFGVWGWIGYIIPVILFFGVAIFYLNRSNKKMYFKLAAGLILLLSICTISSLLLWNFDTESTVQSYYEYASQYRTGGGFIGSVIAKYMSPAIGYAGTIIIEIVLIIICLVVISEKSFIDLIKLISGKAHEDVSKKSQKMRMNIEEKKVEKLQNKSKNQKESDKDRERIVSGVTFDTTLPKYPTSEKEIVENIPDLFEEAPVQKKERKPRKTKETSIEIDEQTKKIAENIEKRNDSDGTYVFPPITLLSQGEKSSVNGESELKETALKLQQTLLSFGVNVQVTNYSRGPSVTRYELQPEKGVKVSKIVSLADDIKLNLAAEDIRIEAPIPGKAAVGIEVPNKENSTVNLRTLLESQEFLNHESNIAFAAGKDIGGRTVVADIGKMPHVLIAGATGSGKSVCINTLIMSILFKANPEDVKLIMIDPKVVELSVYNGIPHLMIPVVTDPKKAAGALHWAVTEMTKRYQLFAEYSVRDLKGYNDKIKNIEEIEDETKPEKMPQIVVIVDELADLMMVAPGEVEEAICRLAQLARAAGIHLILATQRPSVNVITGLIKANMPSRIAFAVSSGIDSRTIIDMNGAEKLLGKGDMLFYPSGYPKPARVQGAFVSDKEVQKVVEFLVEQQGEVTYNKEVEEHVSSSASGVGNSANASGSASNEVDAYFVEAGKFIIEKDKASIGMLQRMFKVGFNRAARIMDQLCDAGVVGEEEGTKPRKVLMSIEEFEQYIDEYI